MAGGGVGCAMLFCSWDATDLVDEAGGAEGPGPVCGGYGDSHRVLTGRRGCCCMHGARWEGLVWHAEGQGLSGETGLPCDSRTQAWAHLTRPGSSHPLG